MTDGELDKSFFSFFSVQTFLFGAFLLLATPIVYGVFVGYRINPESIEKTFKSSINAGVKFKTGKFYFGFSPRAEVEELSFSSDAPSAPLIYANKAIVVYPLSSIFTVKSSKIKSLTLQEAKITIKQKIDDSSNIANSIKSSLESTNLLSTEHGYLLKLKNSSLYYFSNSKEIVKFESVNLNFNHSNHGNDLDGSFSVFGSILNVSVSTNYDNSPSFGSEDSPTQFKIWSDSFSVTILNSVKNNKSSGSFNLRIENLYGFSKILLDWVLPKVGGKISNSSVILAKATFSTDDSGKIIVTDGSITDDKDKKIGNFALSNLQNLYNLNIKIDALDLKQIKENDKSSQNTQEQSKFEISYDNDDIEFLKSDNVSNWVESWSDNDDYLDKDKISDLIKSLVNQNSTILKISDFLPQYPINITANIANVKLQNTDKSYSISLNSTLASDDLRINDLLLSSEDKLTSYSIKGSLESYESFKRRFVFHIDAKDKNINSIYPSFSDGIEMFELQNNKPFTISLDGVIHNDYLLYDNIVLSFENDPLLVTGRIQVNFKPNSQLPSYSSSYLNFYKLKISDINYKELFSSQRKTLLNEFLKLKKITYQKDFNITCKSCIIAESTSVDLMEILLSITNSSFKASVTKMQSKDIDATGSINIETGGAFPSMDIILGLNKVNLDLIDQIFPFNEVSKTPPNAKDKQFFMPSLAKFSGKVDIKLGAAWSKRYLFDKLDVSASIESGIVNIKNFLLSGKSRESGLGLEFATSGTMSYQDIPVYSLAFSASGFNLASFSEYFANKSPVSGSSYITGKLVSQGDTLYETLLNLDSNINFSAKSVLFKNFDLNSIVKPMLNRSSLLIRSISTTEKIESAILNGKNGYYKTISCGANLKNGIFSFSDLKLSSNGLSGNFAGNFKYLDDPSYNIKGKVAMVALNPYKRLSATMPILLTTAVEGSYSENDKLVFNTSQVLQYSKLRLGK